MAEQTRRCGWNHQQCTDQDRADDFHRGNGDQRHQNHEQIIQRLHRHAAHRRQLRVETGEHDAVVQRQGQGHHQRADDGQHQQVIAVDRQHRTEQHVFQNVHVDLARQNQQQARAQGERHREKHTDQGVRRQAGAVAQVVEQDAEQQAVTEQAAIRAGVGFAEQNADGHASQRCVTHRFGEKREALDHHQRAQTAQHRTDQQPCEQRVDHKSIRQRFRQVTRRGPALDHQTKGFVTHQAALRGWVENSVSRRSGVNASFGVASNSTRRLRPVT
ncbi:hypothetical protein D3C86_1215590 [compost metagenome]